MFFILFICLLIYQVLYCLSLKCCLCIKYWCVAVTRHMLQIIYSLAQVPMIHFDFQLYVIIITGAWTQSELERIHRCTGHHTSSPCLFLHTCLRSRGRVPASLWLTGLLTRHLVAKAGRRSVIHVTHRSSEEGTMVFVTDTCWVFSLMLYSTSHDRESFC